MHGTIPPERFFGYLRWTEIDSMPHRENVVIIQPLGALEQHGPHLPLIVDSAIGLGVLGKALSLLEKQVEAYSLPCLYYGKSNEHAGFAGTISLTSQTFYNILLEVADSLYQAGFRKLIFFNSHGGQPQIVETAARDIRHKYQDFWVFPHFLWRAPSNIKELLSSEELEYGLHAGDSETSIMLSLLPEQVKMSLASREYPPQLTQNNLLSIEGDLPFAWLTRDISQTGVIGDPTTASKEKGDLLLQSLAKSWAQIIQEVYEFPKAH
jgi:creatinine amidohydrolase